MPLLDHFRPPLSQRRHWDSFHGAWAEAMASSLNLSSLPQRYVAETRVKLDSQIENDPDSFEVQILSEELGSRLVAAIELVSPANKDRPAHRTMFAVKCASYLQSSVSVIIVDVVTNRAGNLHAEMLQLLQAQIAATSEGADDLYAAAYRTVPDTQGLRLETWPHVLSVGSTLPTLPLWLHAELALPLDLEASYLMACAARRIEP